MLRRQPLAINCNLPQKLEGRGPFKKETRELLPGRAVSLNLFANCFTLKVMTDHRSSEYNGATSQTNTCRLFGPSSAMSRAYTFLFSALFILIGIFGFRTSYPDGHHLLDFGVFFLSGYSASKDVNPYGSIFLSEVQNRYDIEFSFPNLSPPFIVLLWEKFSFIEPVKTFEFWYFLSFLIFSGALLPLIKKWPQSPKFLGLLWAMASAPLWATLSLGQIYIPLLVLVICTYHFLMKERWRMAGIMIGLLVAVKPNFLFVVFLFLCVGYGQVGFTALTVASLLSALPLLKFGPIIYQQWSAVCLTVGNSHAPSCLSPVAFVAHVILESLAFQYVLTFVACVFSIWLGIRRKSSPSLVMDLGLTTTLFITPISWVGYALLLLPALFARNWDWLLISGALLLCIPAHLIWSFSESTYSYANLVGAIYPTAWILISSRIARDCLYLRSPIGSPERCDNRLALKNCR